MKRKIALFAVVVFVLALVAVPTYAAITDQQKTEIEALNKQINELRKQVVDKYAATGELTKEQAEAAKARIDSMEQYRQQNGLTNPGGFGFGPGCGVNGGSSVGCGGFGPNNSFGPNSNFSNR
ncbi:MAG: YckD family protein [Desulfitobacterium hafniense]|nr:YckD family protein [Desulfitobacterium hafniense]